MPGSTPSVPAMEAATHCSYVAQPPAACTKVMVLVSANITAPTLAPGFLGGCVLTSWLNG